MPKLSRKDTKIFSALATNVIQFGSTRQGSAVPSTDPDVLQLLAAYEEGWNSGVIGGTEVPPKGEFNALQFIVSRALAYLEQETLVEYTLTTEYHTDSIARTPTGTTLYKSAIDDYNIGDRALDTNGDIYVSLTNGNIGNLLTDPVNWELTWVFLGDLADLAKVAQATESVAGLSLLSKQITIANNSVDSDHDIDFTAGNFQFDDGTGQATIAALTKQIDVTWAAGNNAGGLDTGAVAIDETYHMFAIYNPSTLASDFLFSLSPTSPTLPSGFTKKRRIGSLVTDGAANIRNGIWVFNRDNSCTFVLDDPLIIQNGSPPTTTVQTINCEAPSGIKTLPLVSVYFNSTAADGIEKFLLFSRVGAVDITPTITKFDFRISQGNAEVEGTSANINFIQTDTTQQIRYRTNSTACNLVFFLRGWIDNNL
jgi:hypothetical protein